MAVIQRECTRCNRIFEADGYKARFCPTCRKIRLSEIAKERNLNKLGNDAYSEKANLRKGEDMYKLKSDIRIQKIRNMNCVDMTKQIANYIGCGFDPCKVICNDDCLAKTTNECHEKIKDWLLSEVK